MALLYYPSGMVEAWLLRGPLPKQFNGRELIHTLVAPTAADSRTKQATCFHYAGLSANQEYEQYMLDCIG